VEVSVFEPTGSETLIFGRTGGVPIDALIRERIEVDPGRTMYFHIDPRRAHIFDRETGQRL
jgi:multiple sugar transport system ATP-binding protein